MPSIYTPHQIKKPPKIGWFFDYKLLVLSLACCFRLLLALNAGLLVVLTLAKIGQDIRPCALTLEATKGAVQGLAFLHSDFCHFFFPPLAYAGDWLQAGRTQSANSLHIIPYFFLFVNRFLKILFVFSHKNPRLLPRVFGADNQIRTDDLLITNEVLYRLSYISALNCDLHIIA